MLRFMIIAVVIIALTESFSPERANKDKRAAPYCNGGCLNGVCIKTNVCKCNFGYKKYTANICRPHCDLKCGFGYCSAPNKCTCIGGHKWVPARRICD